MTNSRIHAAIALGCALIAGAFVAFLPPIPPASAQSQAQQRTRAREPVPRARDRRADRRGGGKGGGRHFVTAACRPASAPRSDS